MVVETVTGTIAVAASGDDAGKRRCPHHHTVAVAQVFVVNICRNGGDDGDGIGGHQ